MLWCVAWCMLLCCRCCAGLLVECFVEVCDYVCDSMSAVFCFPYARVIVGIESWCLALLNPLILLRPRCYVMILSTFARAPTASAFSLLFVLTCSDRSIAAPF